MPSATPRLGRCGLPAALGLVLAAPTGCAASVSLDPQSPPDFVYVLSVASFQDSDGDGLGDLQGVRWHLEHVRSLGVHTLQLTPIQPGWDVGRTVPSGFGVDAALGSAGDLGDLAEDLHRLGMTIEVQLPMEAVGRTHAWFRQSLRGAGRLELGVLDAPGWCPTGDLRYYFASGGCGRADLDWDDPGLPGDMAAGVADLLSAGVDGVVFRPFVPEGARSAVEAARATLAAVQAGVPTVRGAAWTDEPTVESLRPWTAFGAVADLPRSLAWDAAARDRELGWVDDVLEDWGDDAGSTRPYLADYDGSRLASRVADGELRRTLTVLHLLGPGHPAIYYGEELDLADATTLPVDSPWRAPMPWTAEWNCGFSDSEPWFEADPACKVGVNAYDEARAPGSMLTLVRWLAKVRAAWGEASATRIPTGFDDVMAFQSGALVVLGSVSRESRVVQVEGGGEDLETGLPVGPAIVLPPGGWRVVREP